MWYMHRLDSLLGPLGVGIDLVRYHIISGMVAFIENGYSCVLSLLILNLLYLIYYIILRPMPDKKMNLDVIAIEFIAILALVGLLVLAILDERGNDDPDLRMQIGKVIFFSYSTKPASIRLCSMLGN